MDPCKDAFPTGMEIIKAGDQGLDDKYKQLSKTLFGKGDSEDEMVKLVEELKEAIKKEGLQVPGKYIIAEKSLLPYQLEEFPAKSTLRSLGHRCFDKCFLPR